MERPSKRHDGKTITIRYLGAMEPSYDLTGKYIHEPRRGTFHFVMANGHYGVFERCDFVIVKPTPQQ